MDKIDEVIKMLDDRMTAYKIARSVVRYDSAEKAIIDVRIEDLQYLKVKVIKIKNGEQEDADAFWDAKRKDE